MTGAHVAAPALLEAVREDNSLTPEEKETTVRFSKRDGVATVYTAEAGIGRRLLAHRHIQVDGVTVGEGAARRDVTPEAYTEGPIFGVRARVPVGCLKVRLSRRTTTQHAPVVSKEVLQEVRQ
jgi:hypothetical protein